MITPVKKDYITTHAYVPEHLPGYVNTISQTEPYLFRDYLCYYGKGTLIFIGYPLKEPFDESVARETLSSAIKKYDPEYVSLITPVALIPRDSCDKNNSDHYYKIDLYHFNVNQKLRNMIKRASRELYSEKRQELSNEHTQLILEFLSSHNVDDATRSILERIPQYVSSVETAHVFSARNKAGRLIAFDIVEFGAKNYAFYMFNFVSHQHYVPGASDFLIYEVVRVAQEQGKSSINLGLGIHRGIIFFKRKWGGIPFLPYEFCFYQRSHRNKLKYLFEKFS
ncbi:MAG: hypothetical protein OEZ31_03570 [Nitrospirota bacterium]|nr:hypothetical protein [Nitrospirota bacterium]MDH5768020.1 hypothetical protein [Nitrospirota bacterium]